MPSAGAPIAVDNYGAHGATCRKVLYIKPRGAEAAAIDGGSFMSVFDPFRTLHEIFEERMRQGVDARPLFGKINSPVGVLANA